MAYYSGRQSTVALCTAMEETIALAKLVVKVKYMRAILIEMQCRQEQETMINSTRVWAYNTAAIAVATGNDFTHETVKHETFKVRFLQECVQRCIIIVYINDYNSRSIVIFALGMIDLIAAVIAAVAEIRCKIRIRLC
jgi:hypothetical protein